MIHSSVVYAAYSLPETFQEVPQILARKAPNPDSLHTQVASNRFNSPPVAIVIGGGYDDEALKTLYDASVKACGGSKRNLGVAFFRADNALTDKLVAEGRGPEKRSEGYPAAITKRLKGKLAEVGVQNGIREDHIGEVFLY